jgi:hypothetical protein
MNWRTFLVLDLLLSTGCVLGLWLYGDIDLEGFAADAVSGSTAWLLDLLPLRLR